MMVFLSCYTIVDGFFIASFVGKEAFAAVNLVFPILMAAGTPGFLLGTGGSAFVGAALGRKEPETANRIFSLLAALAVGVGLLLSVILWLLMPEISRALGADARLLPDCISYGRIIAAALPCFMIQSFFQSFYITAGKPNLGFASTIAAGVTNIGLDALFIIVFGWGVAGAAAATAISELLCGLFPLLYFSRPNTSLLRFVRPSWMPRVVLDTVINGSSELMSSIAMSVVGICYNLQLLHYAGNDGVAAYGTVIYTAFVFVSAMIGFSEGVAPAISFHFGAKNYREVKSLFKKSVVILALTGILMTILSAVFADFVARLFDAGDAGLHGLIVNAMTIYGLSYLLCWFTIFGSAFFTALGNGPVSAAISFTHTLVLETGCVFLIPFLIGINGIWFSISVAELLSAFVTGFFLLRGRKIFLSG